jgi:hypothetical protein
MISSVDNDLNSGYCILDNPKNSITITPFQNPQNRYEEAQIMSPDDTPVISAV